jgi:MFS family permease
MQTNLHFTRFFIFLSFLSHSIMFSTWFFNVPAVTQRLQLPSGSLLGSYLGAVLRVGSRKRLALLALAFNVFFTLSALLPIFSNTFNTLCVALFFLGFSSALLNISMNSLALRYETKFTVRIVGKCHAVYSIGALFNLTTASILAVSNLNLGVYIALLIGLIIAFQIFCLFKERDLLQIFETPTPDKRSTRQFKLQFLPLLFIALITMLIEDALSNWSSLFLIREHSFSGSLAAIGLLIFNSCMLVGRLSGDGLSKRMQTDKLLMYALLIVSAGLGVLVSGVTFVLVAFVLIGLGCSIIVPTLYRHFNTISQDGTAILTATGSAAFLISPLIMGYVSDLFSLRASFILILALFVTAFLISSKFFPSVVTKPK